MVVGVSNVPQAVRLPQKPGPYQVADLKTVQLGDELGCAVGGAVLPGAALPPVCALAAGAATQMAAAHANPAITRIVRLLVKNLPLSVLTGLADGLALKDRATRQTARDSPQLLGPPISGLCELAEIQRKNARQVSRGLPTFRHRLLRSFRAEPSSSTGIAHSICSARCRERWSRERDEGWASRSRAAWSAAAMRSPSPTSTRRTPPPRRSSSARAPGPSPSMSPMPTPSEPRRSR